jgi:hypothetical protein
MLSPKTRDTVQECLELRQEELTGRLERMTATSTTHASIVENVRDDLASIEAALAELERTEKRG